MLTNKDLQAIGLIIDERLETKLEEKLEEKLGQKLDNKFKKFEERLEIKLEVKLNAKFDEKLAPIYRELTYIKNILRKVTNDQSANYIDHESRMARLEDKVFT